MLLNIVLNLLSYGPVLKKYGEGWFLEITDARVVQIYHMRMENEKCRKKNMSTIAWFFKITFSILSIKHYKYHAGKSSSS